MQRIALSLFAMTVFQVSMSPAPVRAHGYHRFGGYQSFRLVVPFQPVVQVYAQPVVYQPLAVAPLVVQPAAVLQAPAPLAIGAYQVQPLAGVAGYAPCGQLLDSGYVLGQSALGVGYYHAAAPFVAFRAVHDFRTGRLVDAVVQRARQRVFTGPPRPQKPARR